jgi:hypothetical protein
MSTTARLLLPYIAPQQSQKQFSYNTAMALLDQLVQPVVISAGLATPPADPQQGDCYVVAASPSGAWSGKAAQLTCWRDGGWAFIEPAEGWLVYAADSGLLLVHTDGDWLPLATSGGTALAKLGINVAADLTDRLAIAAASSRFTHDGAGHQLKISKATTADTASLVLQTADSGRAEIGIVGDDTLRLKVSADGSNWVDALLASAAGIVSLPAGKLAFPATQSPSSDPNTLDDYEEGDWTPVVTLGGATTGITYDGAATLGRYTKVGRKVSVSGAVKLTSKGSASGAAMITGLPFTARNDGLAASAAFGYATAMSSISGAIIGMVAANQSRVSLFQSANGAAASLTSANFTNTTHLMFSVTYDS